MLKYAMSTNQDPKGITKSQPKTIQLNIFSKVNPRNDGMLDSITSQASEIKKSLDNESSYTEKIDQNQIPPKNITPPTKINNNQVMKRHTSPQLKNNYQNQYPRYNFTNFNNIVNTRNNTRVNVNKNLGKIYYGPNNGNIKSPITKVVIYKRRNESLDCLDDDFCGIF